MNIVILNIANHFAKAKPFHRLPSRSTNLLKDFDIYGRFCFWPCRRCSKRYSSTFVFIDSGDWQLQDQNRAFVVENYIPRCYAIHNEQWCYLWVTQVEFHLTKCSCNRLSCYWLHALLRKPCWWTSIVKRVKWSISEQRRHNQPILTLDKTT